MISEIYNIRNEHHWTFGSRMRYTKYASCYRFSFVSLLVGLLFGFFCAKLLAVMDMVALQNEYIERERLQNSREGKFLKENIIDSQHSNHELRDTSLARQLYNETRVLCWIMTGPSNHKSRAIHVKRTWGKRCNKLLIMSSENDSELDVIKLPVKEGHDQLWGKTKEAFKYIYEHHLNEYDWVYKADDDTYAIVENLRYLLYPYSPETPIYFGFKFGIIIKQGYMSGGAGYVLSKEAVRRFVKEAIPNSKLCKSDNTGAEDAEIGICLQNVNVIAGDSRDDRARGRFFAFKPADHLLAKVDKSFWYWKNSYYKTDEGLDFCSPNAISFHYVEPNEMYVMDYLIYHLHPFGIINYPPYLSKKLQVNATLPSPIESTNKITKDYTYELDEHE